MNLAIIGVATKGYGKFVKDWITSIINQTVAPKEIILVLGIDHGLDNKTLKLLKDNKVKVIYEQNDLFLGELLNKAVEEITSEYCFRLDIDDEILPQCIAEIQNTINTYNNVSVVSLNFKVNNNIKTSPIIQLDKLHCWRKDFTESGYTVNKIKYNGEKIYYDNTDFPNFPYLFKLASYGFKFMPTDGVCVEYKKREESKQTFLKDPDKEQLTKDLINEAYFKYRTKDIILSVIVPMYNNEKLIKKCLESIELREDVEVIMMDDCSTDDTVKNAKQWMAEHPNDNIKLFESKKNKGAGKNVNVGYDNAIGEYILTLCDDDYLVKPLHEFINELDGSDLVYFNIRSNSGKIWDGTTLPGSTKAYKRSIIGKTRRPNQNYGGDKIFYKEILDKNPTVKVTNLLLYHYNYPRIGSLMDQWKKKKANETAYIPPIKQINKQSITVYTIVYNNYGKFLPDWIDNMIKQTFKPNIILVLGNNHGADIDLIKEKLKSFNYKLIYTDSNIMGILRNFAIRASTTDWNLYFSADDELLSNACEDIIHCDSDVFALKFIDRSINNVDTIRESAMFNKSEITKWDHLYKIPGYAAVKGLYYYEDIAIPNFPFLFKLSRLKLKQQHSPNICAIYHRRTTSHGAMAQQTHKWEEYKVYIQECANYYKNL